MITVGSKMVIEVRHEWVLQGALPGDIVLDEQDYDEDEARLLAGMEGASLMRRCLYVTEAEPV